MAHDSHQQREKHALNFSQIKARAVWLGLCSTLQSCAADGHSGNGLCFGPAASQFGTSPGFVILPQAAFLISTSSGGDKKKQINNVSHHYDFSSILRQNDEVTLQALQISLRGCAKTANLQFNTGLQ